MATFSAINDYIIPYFNLYTMFPMFMITLHSLIGILIFDLHIRELFLSFVTKEYTVCEAMYNYDFDEMTYLPSKEKQDEINCAVNGIFNKNSHIGHFYNDVNAMKYYFRKNGDSKTLKEIEDIKTRVNNGTLSSKQAYPYDTLVLKEYYRNLIKKICKFPFFSIIDIVLYIPRNIERQKKIKEEKELHEFLKKREEDSIREWEEERLKQ